METEARIPYDEVRLKFNPRAERYPWELWTDGQFELSAESPHEAFEVWASQTELIREYVDEKGKPRHETRPDEYDEQRVLAKPLMEPDKVPSNEVQADLWNALKTTEERFTLDEFCDATGADPDETRRAVNLLSAHDLVGWGTTPDVPWLTQQGEEIEYPEWFDEQPTGGQS